jgi:DSBA-like thioredoxin domain-containing protein
LWLLPDDLARPHPTRAGNADGGGRVGPKMSIPPFSVNYDYRCPFARNAHEHVVEGLRGGSGWDVEFIPFSLTQAHVHDDALAVWDDPAKARDLLAMEAGIVVRQRMPERFLDVHLALFAARHDDGRDLRDPSVVEEVLRTAGTDPVAVLGAVAEGWPRQIFRKEHEQAVVERKVFGVPTFVTGDSAVFVRLMTRPAGDAGLARSTVEHVMSLLAGHPELNEFKHTTISR